MSRINVWLAVAMISLIGGLPDFCQAAQPKDDVLRIAVGTEILSLDNSLFASGSDSIVVENWGEYLLDRATSGEIRPGLVESWKMAPDGKKMECTLRKGVKFHSGDLLTTKDVKFSFDRGKEKNRSTKTNLRAVSRLEIVDDYHFNFYFKQPDVTFIPRRCNIPIVSKSYHERVGEETFVKQPSATGPYKMVKYQPGEYVDLERFEEYWGKKPPVKRARIYFVREGTTRIAKLKAGEVEFIQSVPFVALNELKKSPDFKVVKLENNHPTRGIIFGAKNPKMPWYDKRVRLAMAFAIDRKSIIHNILQDNAALWAALAPSELGYDSTIKPYPYDPKKAKALLAEAGYPNGFDIKMTWETGGRVPMTQEAVEAVASYFAAVGIRTQLVGQETASMLAGRKVALKPDAEYIAYYDASYCGGVDPAHRLMTYFTTGGSRPVFSDPEVDKIVAKAMTTMDDKDRAELIKKAVSILIEEVAMVPVVTNVANYAMRKNVDFVPTNYSQDLVMVKDITVK